ncbi:MAG TPA: hypothetical protein VMW27_10205 [Thermoanaerobaculia bacterium]|nr:hypothetical protein [Thermoanaerobaculia bacterium]
MSELLKLLAPLAGFAAMTAFAARELDPSAAAESGYLALVATAVLLAVAVLAPRPAPETALGAVLAVTAVWGLPPGPGRGAAVLLLLTAALAIAAVRRLAVTLPELPLEVSVPLCLGAQLLLRGDLLFEPALSPRILVSLLVLPVAAAGAATLLARRHGGGLALIAAGTAALAAPGWNVASTLAMVALAMGDLLAWPDLRWPAKATAFLALLAPLAWEPRAAIPAAIAGIALAFPWIAPFLAVALFLYWSYMSLGWGGETIAFPALFLTLPLLGQAFLRFDKARALQILTAVLLLPSLYHTLTWGALAAPLGIAALALDRKGPGLVPQGVWTGALVAGSALLSSYPWMREIPLGQVLELMGVEWSLKASAILLVVGLAVALTPLKKREAVFTAGLVLLALLLHLPSPGTRLLPLAAAVVLDPARPVWEVPLPPGSVRAVVLDSALANGTGLDHGAPVATVRLEKDGAPVREWTLRAGEGTGEWAARRPDVAQTARLQSPPAWICWVADGFFAQRYRALWQVEKPGPFTRLRVERVPGLAPEVTIALHQVEVRR